MPGPGIYRQARIARIESRISETQEALSECESVDSPIARALGQKLTRLARQIIDLRAHQSAPTTDQGRSVSP